MGYGKVANIEDEARLMELRRAWFDGWTEGAVWALTRTGHALRRGAVTMESITSSVLEHLGSGVSDTSCRPCSSRTDGNAEGFPGP